MIITFLLLFPLSACSLLPKEEPVLAPPLVEPATIDYDTVTIKTGDIVKRVKGMGTIVPLDHQPLSFTQSGGRIKKIHVTKGDAVKKGQVLAEVDTGNLQYQLELARINLKKADLRLKQLQSQRSDTYTIDMAKLDQQGIEIQIRQLEGELTNSSIVSPLTGMVTFVTELKIGDLIQAFEPVVQIADTSKLQVIYTATGAEELTDIKIGMKAALSVDGKSLEGKITQTPRDVPKELLEKDPDLYQRSIFISLNDIPKEAEVGSSIDLEIITAKKENVLILPKSALRSSGGRQYVHVFVEEAKREVDIEVGIVSATEVEVISGLDEGDTVILK